MKSKLSPILALFFMLLPGCKASFLTYDYANRIDKIPGEYPTNDVIDVKIKISKGLNEINPPKSITTPFYIEGIIIEGQIPAHPNVKRIKLRLYHDWTDTLVKDNEILTLKFALNGDLFNIKEFTITGIGK